MINRLLLVNVALLFAIRIAAADRGMCGENIAWLFENGELTISGSGNMYDYNNLIRPYENNKNEIKKIIFVGDIESIGRNAFDGYAALETIEFNDGLKKIGASAFRNCVSLKELKLPDSLEMITCFGDETVDIKLGYFKESTFECNAFSAYGENEDGSNFDGAFSNCVSLSSVVFGENLARIGLASFGGCINLKEIQWNSIDCRIPRGIKRTKYGRYEDDLDPFVFYKCPIETIIFGEKVKRVPRKAFYGIKTLNNVVTSGNIEYIGGKAFDETEWADHNKPESGMWYIDNVAYSYVPEPLSADVGVIVPVKEGVLGLSQLAFSDYNSKVKIGECNPIAELIIPKSLKNIGYTAFANYESKNGMVKWNCDELNLIDESISHEMPIELGYARYLCQNMSVADFIFEEGVEVVPEFLLFMANGINRVTMSSTIKEIGDCAFARSHVKIAALPPQVEKIGKFALEDVSIDDLIIPNSTKYIGNSGISTKCSKLTVGENVKSEALMSIALSFPVLTELNWNAIDIIPENSSGYNSSHSLRNGMSGSLKVSLGNKVKVIPPRLLSDLIGSVTINGGESITEISDKAFYKSSGISSVYLPETLSVIGDSAFAKSGLESIIIPSSVTNMSPDAFAECPLKEAIVKCLVPPVKSARIGYYSHDLIAPKVYVPDAEAYKSWIPTPIAMLKSGEYYIGDGMDGTVSLISNIPGYEAKTDYVVDNFVPGEYTVYIPVKFHSINNDFDAVVKYTYTVFSGSSSIADLKEADFYIRINGNDICIENASESVKVFNSSGIKVYEGDGTRISLRKGVYIVRIGNKSAKVII